MTATDDQSRNRQFGKKIAEYNDVSEALNAVGKLVEGYQTSQALDKVEDKSRKIPDHFRNHRDTSWEKKTFPSVGLFAFCEPRSE